jgi:hypothetical protein
MTYTFKYSAVTAPYCVSFILNYYSNKETTKKKFIGKNEKILTEYNRRNVQWTIYPSNDILHDSVNAISRRLTEYLDLIPGMKQD